LLQVKGGFQSAKKRWRGRGGGTGGGGTGGVGAEVEGQRWRGRGGRAVVEAQRWRGRGGGAAFIIITHLMLQGKACPWCLGFHQFEMLLCFKVRAGTLGLGLRTWS